MATARRLQGYGLVAAIALGCGGSTALRTDAGPDVTAVDVVTVDVVTPRDVAVDAGPPNACVTAADCAWSEIRTEINAPADCPCLLGCPTLALNREVAARRQRQYTALCTPGRSGNGQPCPIDDCAQPPALQCRNGLCVAPGG